LRQTKNDRRTDSQCDWAKGIEPFGGDQHSELETLSGHVEVPGINPAARLSELFDGYC
jgi:hypothetical protein